VQRFQSTHPRGVRPGVASVTGRRDGVSIHAPARGATQIDALRFGIERQIARLGQGLHELGVEIEDISRRVS